MDLQSTKLDYFDDMQKLQSTATILSHIQVNKTLAFKICNQIKNVENQMCLSHSFVETLLINQSM